MVQKMINRKMKKDIENHGRNAKKKKKRRSQKGEDGISISITPLPVMTVQTTAMILILNVQKDRIKKVAVLRTEIMILLSVSMDTCLEII